MNTRMRPWNVVGWLPLLVVVGVWLSFQTGRPVFPLDDAYIHLVYARNLSATGSLCFNPGEPSIGTSSPLWVAILALPHMAGCNIYWVVQLANLLLFGALIRVIISLVATIAIRLGYGEHETQLCLLGAGLLLASNGNLHWFALSGMETMLYLCLSFLVVSAYDRRGFDHVTGLLSGLVFLSRATGLVVGLVCILVDLARHEWARVWRGAAALSLVVALWCCFSVHTTGEWIPTTAGGKLASYVDGGLRWNRIPRSTLRNDALVQQLIDLRILEADRRDSGFVRFRAGIHDEAQLAERLRRLGMTNPEYFLIQWRVTHRNHVYWYLKTLLMYQKYQPHNYVLLVAVAVSSLHMFLKYRQRLCSFKDRLRGVAPVLCTIAIWGLSHVALHAVTFRTLLHNTRYLAEGYVILTVLGAVACLGWFRHARVVVTALAMASLALAAGEIPYWRDVYSRNVTHTETVYIRMADWIRTHTPPEARVAAFDVGVLRYVGNRYTVDLGGLVDPTVHPYLKRKECGEYIRAKGAGYVLYSRNLEVDYFTGIYLAEYEGPMLLTQMPVVHVETSQYEAPIFLHSFRLDLVKIRGWFPKTEGGILQAFAYDGRPYETLGVMVDEGLEILGFDLDQRAIEYIPLYPYGVNLTLFYRARMPLVHPSWVHVAFFDTTGRMVYLLSHMPTHNLLPFDRWPVNDVIQEHHLLFAPVDMPVGRFRIRLTATRSQLLDRFHTTQHVWYDLGEFENCGNVLKPMDHQQLMSLP